MLKKVAEGFVRKIVHCWQLIVKTPLMQFIFIIYTYAKYGIFAPFKIINETFVSHIDLIYDGLTSCNAHSQLYG